MEDIPVVLAQISSLKVKLAEKTGKLDKTEEFLVRHWQKEIEKLNKALTCKDK